MKAYIPQHPRTPRHGVQETEASVPQNDRQHKPSDSGLHAGFLFSGQSHDTIPRQLLLDRRLTPLERNAWQVFRLLLGDQGIVTPRYEDLQPFLSSVPHGGLASRETIARILTVLRLTRWLSLVSRGRDAQGRMLGSLYVLHDEPLSPAEALELDPDYLELTEHCLEHAAKTVRLVAQHVVDDIREDSHIEQHTLLTRLMAINLRLSDQGLIAIANPSPRDSELGNHHRVRNRVNPRSESERGRKSEPLRPVRNPNAANTVRTVFNTSNKNVPRAHDAESPLHWPTTLTLSELEQGAAETLLAKLELNQRQPVLDEAAARCATGDVRKPAAYLMGLIQRALHGEFHPWAIGHRQPKAKGAPSPTPQTTQDAARTAPRTPDVPLSATVQACLDALRELRNSTA